MAPDKIREVGVTNCQNTFIHTDLVPLQLGHLTFQLLLLPTLDCRMLRFIHSALKSAHRGALKAAFCKVPMLKKETPLAQPISPIYLRDLFTFLLYEKAQQCRVVSLRLDTLVVGMTSTNGAGRLPRRYIPALLVEVVRMPYSLPAVSNCSNC
jgi:hypothetical protein